MNHSELEDKFLFYWRLLATDMPEPIAEYRFDKVRKFRFDFCWQAAKVAVELQGDIWNQGKHTRGKGYLADCDKNNLAIEQGYVILTYTINHLRDDPNAAIEQICRVIAMRVNDHA